MKNIREIENLSVADLERIGADESIPVPAGWRVRLPHRKTKLRPWGIAAAATLLIAMGWWGLVNPRHPKDSFDDPYLAYAAVEAALTRVSGSLHATAGKVAESEALIDKVNYLK